MADNALLVVAMFIVAVGVSDCSNTSWLNKNGRIETDTGPFQCVQTRTVADQWKKEKSILDVCYKAIRLKPADGSVFVIPETVDLQGVEATTEEIIFTHTALIDESKTQQVIDR